MTTQEILSAIDEEIARLNRVRALLADVKPLAAISNAMRPKKTVKKAVAVKSGRRKLSPEARARIVEAQKRRWAAAKKGK